MVFWLDVGFVMDADSIYMCACWDMVADSFCGGMMLETSETAKNEPFFSVSVSGATGQWKFGCTSQISANR
jgi:hypothetical protein